MNFQFPVVIPCYHLVWYNKLQALALISLVVIPCYHLVWYNNQAENNLKD